MKITLAFDVYGTLVDPSGMAKHLADDLQIEAASFADFWREKQLEYSFRRGLMQNYADFSICTSDALNFTCRHFKVSISSERRAELLGLYQHLPRFDDVTPALYSLQAAFRLFAFSNGKRSEIDAVLSNANILEYFEGIVTADDVRSFKPNPAVYSYARRVTRAWSSPFWLVSSNPWDVIGARSAGLSSAWVQRSEEKIYDPWGVEPNSEALKEVAAEVKSSGADSLAFPLDLSMRESAETLIKGTLDRFGRIDALLNIAGAVPQIDLFEMTDEQWQDGLELKLHGARGLTILAWEALKVSKGSGVLISGSAALDPKPGFAAVATINAAIIALAKAFAEQGIKDGIQVNSVVPGPVMTGRRQSSSRNGRQPTA